jgi:hypothetical protein
MNVHRPRAAPRAAARAAPRAAPTPRTARQERPALPPYSVRRHAAERSPSEGAPVASTDYQLEALARRAEAQRSAT